MVEARPCVAAARLVIGIGFGYLLFRVLDHRAVAIVMAMTTLIFVALWLSEVRR